MTKKEQELSENRIRVFIKRIHNLIYEENIPLQASFCKFKNNLLFAERKSGTYKPIQVGDCWGENWEKAWFKLTGGIPKRWAVKCVVAVVNLGGEALLFSDEGVPELGLSVHTLWATEDFRRDRVPVSDCSAGNEKIELWIEATAAQLFGLEMNWGSGDLRPENYGNYQAQVKILSLAVFRKDIWHLYLDCSVLNDQMLALPDKSVRRRRILSALNRTIDCFSGEKKAVQQAGNILKPELAKKSSPSDLNTLAIGHAHLDTAWLWPIHETIRKCARTFSSQIALLDKYPDYVFGASQPQQYAYVKEYYPALFEKIKQKIAEKRWEPLGGMWVEADCNIISGESLVRQILHGKNYFRAEFNTEVKNLWLTDVFGYNAAMPQIIKKSGLDYFITQKMSWSQFNKFPHHTFLWRGIDGSEVITHFPPENDYNSVLNPAKLIFAQENFEEKGFLDEFITIFGIGDGGGGPSEEIIETGLRQTDLEGSPQIVFGFARDMLDRLDSKREKLPVWVGELYLELHRGTLTTQAYNKKMNRYMELRLRELEIVYSLLPLEKYPADQFDRMWKKLLLHQFHDIIPGSSITAVYQDCRKDYEELSRQSDQLKNQFEFLLLKKKKNKLCLINTLSFTYTGYVELPVSFSGYELSDHSGKIVPVQTEQDKVLARLNIKPLSQITLTCSEKKENKETKLLTDNFILENELIRVEFNPGGTIKTVYDKECKKEVIKKGEAGNILSLYEDRPVAWDAWDIDIYYENQLLETAKLQSRTRICDGPVRQGIVHNYTIGKSKITQKIYLAVNSKRLDFDTEVAWQEIHKMLRVSFVTTIRSDTATFDIQYGFVKRNTHRNSSWDKAKFEVAAHRFADLSDKEYGVALLNNCKYGYKVFENIIDLNLLRATIVPDPEADLGTHHFIYSLFPHHGEMIESDTLAQGTQLNQHPLCFFGVDGSEVNIPYKLDTEDIVLETIKKAELENSIILRLYEPKGKNVAAVMKIALENIEVFETDLMENNLHKMKLIRQDLPLQFTPFEIKTIKIVSEKVQRFRVPGSKVSDYQV